ncbi:MAG TPA: DUF4255 domain-containing protein [Rubrobacter sp.]|nr:DUF4255 domain-containing protein [Rubrobacter sp.]
MSNYLAIATVTSVLSQIIGAASEAAVPGAGVTTQRPGAPTGNATPDSGPHVNLYLYQVSPNAAWRGDDLPTRDRNGGLVQRPRAALDLFYLLSFFGDEGDLEPQRILGSVATALHARPVLTRENIRSVVRTAVNADPNHYLAGSDLADQVELVKFSPLPLNLEELSKLWSVFLQTPYALSVAYQGSVVLLEADGSPRLAAPVRERNVYVEPMRRPVIEELLSRQGPNDPPAADRPIISSDQLVIKGTQLRGDDTQVLVGGIEAPSLDELSNTRIVLSIPAGVQAGTRAVRVVNRAMIGTPPSPHAGVESNPETFVLRPRITGQVNANVQISGNQPRSGDVTVQLSPEVGRTQRVSLVLNEKQPPDTRPPRSYTFDAPPRTQPTDPETSASVTIPVSGLVAGQYLVRVRVDGAESLLDTDASGAYTAPEVDIP